MVAPIKSLHTVLFIACFYVLSVSPLRKWNEREISVYRERVRSMFYHAYDGYIDNAYPYDELRPITCDGYDTWGSFSLTLVDALDTLAVMGNYSEFRRVATLIANTLEFDIDVNASVFETNIRIVGGLLSAHLMYKRAGMELEPGWPCTGPLLRMAENVARRLLPAFNTTTGMPYGTVNLRHGVPKGETPITCTAGVGTFAVEFGALSKLTGDPVFESTAMRAMNSLWELRSDIGLVGNHINVMTGAWTALDAGIGAGVDSYFEYLVKGSILFQRHEYMEMFHEYVKKIEHYLKKDDWYMWANMKKGSITLPMFQSLEAFWPGIQSLVGDVDKGMKTIHNYHQVWRQFGFTPEFYNIVKQEPHVNREGYPLRPELIESAMYLYQATKDPYLLDIGADIVEAIDHSAKTKCGYATIKEVVNHSLDNRMESFFLAETTKYLYLLFDPDNFIHNTGNHGTLIQTPNGECIIDAGGYVFNTEAHPIDVATLYCCSVQRNQDLIDLQKIQDNVDLLQLLDLVDNHQSSIFDVGKTWKNKRTSKERPPKDDPIMQEGVSDVDDLDEFEKIIEDDESEEEKHIEEIIGDTLPSEESSESENGGESSHNEHEKRDLNEQVLVNTQHGDEHISIIETNNIVIETDSATKLHDTSHSDHRAHKSKHLFSRAKPRELLLTCPAGSFTQRLSVLGEMFVEIKT